MLPWVTENMHMTTKSPPVKVLSVSVMLINLVPRVLGRHALRYSKMAPDTQSRHEGVCVMQEHVKCNSEGPINDSDFQPQAVTATASCNRNQISSVWAPTTATAIKFSVYGHRNLQPQFPTATAICNRNQVSMYGLQQPQQCFAGCCRSIF